MSLISPDVAKQIKQALSGMQAPVKFLVFSQGEGGAIECTYCSETRQLVEELAALDDRISFEVRDFLKDAELAEAYHIDKIPAIALIRNESEPVDYGIRFYGIPAGYEFSSLMEDILMVSRGQHGLSEKTMQELARLDRPVHIQVYVTPT
jgi:glutaredoxin-like protein